MGNTRRRPVAIYLVALWLWIGFSMLSRYWIRDPAANTPNVHGQAVVPALRTGAVVVFVLELVSLIQLRSTAIWIAVGVMGIWSLMAAMGTPGMIGIGIVVVNVVVIRYLLGSTLRDAGNRLREEREARGRRNAAEKNLRRTFDKRRSEDRESGATATPTGDVMSVSQPMSLTFRVMIFAVVIVVLLLVLARS